MFPQYIAKQLLNAERIADYQRNCDLYEGEHWKIFNIDEQEKKLHKYEYIAYNILATAVDIKTDMIWREAPQIKFKSTKTQKAFDQLRKSTQFDEKLRNATWAMLVYGDAPLKIAIDENTETAKDELQLCLYNLEPEGWFPDYDEYNPAKPAKVNSLLFTKTIDDKTKAFLVESHMPGKIVWTAYIETDQVKDKTQVSPLEYFANELADVLANGGTKATDSEIVYNTDCEYSLLQVLRNNTDFSEYFGVSDFTLPVISKVNALNNFANLANFVIATNSIPKLILSENASKMLTNIIESINQNRIESENRPGVPDSFIQEPNTKFLHRTSYLRSMIYRELVQQLQAFEDGGRGETKYLTNSFDLAQIREQHEIFFKSLMSELGISEVLYNPALATGGLSGVAYMRLLSPTLNAVDGIKRKLEPYLQKVVYTMLEVANKNSLINTKPEMPEVHFKDGVINDDKETLDAVVIKYQNKLLPAIEAIKQANNLDEEQANLLLTQIHEESAKEAGQEDPETNQDSENEEEL